MNIFQSIWTFITILVLLVISSYAFAADMFEPRVDYLVGTSPRSVAVGDLDGNGSSDLAVANYDTNNASVLLNNGDGTFQAAINYPAGTRPISVAMGDLDGNGSRDLALTNNTLDTVSVLKNNGDGTFQGPVAHDVGDAPKSVAIGDLDGNDSNDLVTSNGQDNTVSVLLNNGDGTFQSAVDYTAWMFPCNVAMGDLDGNGSNDLATTNAYSSDISVLLNNGDGTFQAAVNYPVGPNPRSVKIGDLNGNGLRDLAVTVGVPAHYVSVLLGNGDGTFQGGVDYAVGTEPYSVAIGLLDGNGSLDFAVANYESDDVSVLLNNGDGTYQAADHYAVGDKAISVAIGDLDGVEGEDLAVTCREDDKVSVFINKGVIQINDLVRASGGSGSCPACAPVLTPGYPRFTEGSPDLYEDYITIQSLSATGIQMPIHAVLGTLSPGGIYAFNPDGGGGAPPTGYWAYSLSSHDGTTSADDVLDLDERITRIWQFADDGGSTFSFWVDVYASSAKDGLWLGKFDFSPDCGKGRPTIGEDRDLFVLDDQTAEIYAGSTTGSFIIANRFTASIPVSLRTVSFHTSGWAAGDKAEVILYEDASGTASGPEPSMEVWRTSVVLGSGGFQEVSADDCPVLNLTGSPGAVFYVAVANSTERSYTLGIDMSGPYAGASFVSKDGGLTFTPLSAMPIIDGNSMIQAQIEDPEICFVDVVM